MEEEVREVGLLEKPIDKKVTKELVDIYMSLPEECRKDIMPVGNSGWTLKRINHKKNSLGGRSYSIDIGKADDLDAWKYLAKRDPIRAHFYFYSYNDWITDDIQAMLEHAVKYVTAPGYVITGVISREEGDKKVIGFVIDEEDEMVAYGDTYEGAAMNLLKDSWWHIYEYLTPSLSNLENVVDINEDFMGKPTVIVKDFYRLKNNPRLLRYITFLPDSVGDIENYFGEMHLMEGDYHIVCEGYGKPKEDIKSS
jgi:hypothetical protein